MEMHEALRREGRAPGQIALALRGHDKGRLFLLIGAAGRRVWMCDGRHYSWARPKCKHVRHVRPLADIGEAAFAALRDSADEKRREAETRALLKRWRMNNVEGRCD